MRHRRRRVQGYIDFGPTPWPILPAQIVMVDRDTGVQWFLTHDTGPTTVVLTTDIPTTPDTVFYGPDGGPWLAPNIRLYIASGVLTFEQMDTEFGVDYNPRVYTRKGRETVLIEVGYDPGTDALTYTPRDVTPT